MKLFILFLIAIFISLSGYTQNCLPEGINFYLQSTIDSFQIVYPNCTHIQGNVMIGGSISNLNGLRSVTSIGGNLGILFNPFLTNLTGLNKLNSIGSYLDVAYNPNLQNLNGLNGLVSVGENVLIRGNNSLDNLSGLDSLTTIAGDLRIYNNYKLTNISGLHKLSNIGGGLGIYNDSVLISLTGLEQIRAIPGELIISEDNALQNLTGLNNLISCGYLQIENDPALLNLLALSNLSTAWEGLLIAVDTSLTTLSGLEKLTHLNGYLSITWNNSLISLSGIDNIKPDSIAGVMITDNKSLTTCAVKSICSYLKGLNGTFKNNANGCNSQEQVDTACIHLAVDNLTLSNPIVLSPNPTSGEITVETNSISYPCQISVLSLDGHEVLAQQINQHTTVLDLTHLSTGLYFIRLVNDKTVMLRKIIKE